MDQREQEFLKKIETLLDSEKARFAIDKAVLETKAMLDADPERLTAAVQVSLSVFGDSLPSEIKSCRVFALRAGLESRTECHPNSHQRVLSLEGTGEIRVFDDPEPYTVFLRSDMDGPFELRWGSLQENIWHQPVAGPEDWVVLTFHTASEAELIDEYRDRGGAIMEQSTGWSGRILRVNLTEQTHTISPTAEYKPFVGSQGINQYILIKELPVGIDPLSPENILVFGAGPLVGTIAPASCRMSIDCKNVLTGGTGSANVGGHFAPELKRAGYDHIVVTGKADHPMVLSIKDDAVRFLDASHIWGMGIQETSRQIRAELNDPRVRMASIGPAGENLVAFACIIVDEGRAAGFSGCGAVMGSKNLKAIAVRGSRKIPIAHPAFLKEIAADIRKRIDSSPDVEKMREGGTHLLAAAGGRTHSGPQGTRNLQDGFWSKEKSKNVKEPVFKPHEINKLACFNCPVHCSHLYEIPDGENKGRHTEGIQANTVRAFSSNLDIDDPQVVLNANFLCNDLGLDVDGTGAALGWAFECFEKGLLSEQDTEGFKFSWGNGEAALALIKKIALRQGIGDLLAGGVLAAAKKFGRKSEEYAMHIKGAPINESCMRTHKGWALGIVTSTRGAGHLRGAPNTEQKTIPPEVSLKLWGVPNADDPGSYEGKAKLVAWFEAFKAVVDALGICYFTTYWRDMHLIGPKDMSDLLYGATGLKIHEDELLKIGEKIVNIEKAFNTLHAGFSRKDDLPPERLFRSSVSQGPFKGEYLDQKKWETMLNEYYDCHGWDRKTGRQTEACLDALKLPAFVKDRLKAQNRLIQSD